MVRKRGEKPQREITKRQLSRWQRQKRRQRILLGSGIFIIVVVIGMVGTGWYINQYQPLHQTVIKVNDTEFDMNYYIKMLKFYGQDQSIQYMSFLADEVVTFIERNELIRQEAMKPEIGIIISDEEVDKDLKSRDPPIGKDYRDLVRTEILISKLQDEYFEQKVPVFAEQRHIMAMFLEGENQATEVRTRVERGEDFGELAGELSLESLSKSREGDLGWRPEDVLNVLLDSSILVEYIFDCEVGVLSQPIYDEATTKRVGYWIAKILDRDEDTERAYVQAILLGSAEEAWDVRARLEAGEDFSELAGELSQHEWSKENGGDLDWLEPGIMCPAFDGFVFNPELKLGTLGEPIRDDTAVTTGGYWLLEVVGIDNNRKIEDEDRDLLKAKALNEWLSALWDDPENEVEDFLSNEKKEWAIQQAIES